MQWVEHSIQWVRKIFVCLASFNCFLEISVLPAAEFNAIRGESNVQGSTDFGLLYHKFQAIWNTKSNDQHTKDS